MLSINVGTAMDLELYLESEEKIREKEKELNDLENILAMLFEISKSEEVNVGENLLLNSGIKLIGDTETKAKEISDKIEEVIEGLAKVKEEISGLHLIIEQFYCKK